MSRGISRHSGSARLTRRSGGRLTSAWAGGLHLFRILLPPLGRRERVRKVVGLLDDLAVGAGLDDRDCADRRLAGSRLDGRP